MSRTADLHTVARARRCFLLTGALLLTACATTVESAPTPVSTLPVSSTTSPPPSTTAPVAEAAPATTSLDAPIAPAVTVVPLTGWAALDQYIDVTVIRGGSVAVSVAVMRDGVVEHAAAFGDRVAGDPAEPSDRFRVASISKVLTTVAALQLVEEGTTSLDVPLGPTLAAALGVGSPAAGVTDITMRHLLSHRSGFAQYEDLFFRNQVGSCREAGVVGLTRSLQATPGTTFQYSNLNFCLLGIAIEELAGQPVSDVVTAKVLQPLGIDGMRLADTFDVGDGDVEHRSDAGRNYMEVLESAGAWIAAPEDLIAVLNSLDASTPGTKLLSAPTLAEMKTITTTPPPEPDPNDAIEATEPTVPTVPTAPTTTEAPPPPRTSGYGLGLMIFDAPGGVVGESMSFGHTGTLESTHAMFVRRGDGITWAITVSGDYPSSTRDLAKIMNNALVLAGFVDGDYVAVPPPLATS